MDAKPLRLLRNLGRSREIARVLMRYGFEDVVERLHLGRYVQWGRRVIFRRREPDLLRTRAMRIRLALESLGPTFIKFGQVASTRPDLLPPDVIDELSHLQEKVPSFPSRIAVQILERELGAPLEQLFASFDRLPIAAGSLAQVHRAEHLDGTPLAVKIRRPNVVRDVERDLSLMVELAHLIERHIPEAEIFDPVGLVGQFSRTIRRELNFLREGRTCDEFRRLFRNDATLYVPRVYGELCTEAVLTMEFVEGYRVDQTEEMTAAGICTHSVAANGARIFMKQAFGLGLFHGDPHPGNIRILQDGSVCLLDFGMVGLLEDDKRDRLVDLFLAIARQDVRRVVTLVKSLGQPSRPLDEPLLRADTREFIETYYGVPLEKLKVGNMLSDFVGVLSHHGIRCPPDLMLLIRALVTLEGTGRDLDPQFNLAQYLAPFVEECVKDRFNPKRIKEKVWSETQTLLELAHEMPVHVARTIEKLSQDELKVQFEHRGLDRLIHGMDKVSNRLVIGLVMSSLIVASALIIQAGPEYRWVSLPVFVLSSLLGLWLIYGVFRSGSL
ncbi:MAG: ABC1 kinase family protein [Planctomycetaceae bacterium]